MMRITDDAVSFLDEARVDQHIPEHYGVRLFGPTLDGQGAFQIAFAERPLLGDEVTQTAGQRLFVAPEISGSLEELMLDVVERQGELRLVLRHAT